MVLEDKEMTRKDWEWQETDPKWLKVESATEYPEMGTKQHRMEGQTEPKCHEILFDRD